MPHVRLTQRFVDDLRGASSPDKDVFYWSEREPGFGVKHKAGSGNVSWAYQWRDPRTGRSHRLALGDAAKVKLEAARKAMEARSGEIAAGKNPLQERRRHREARTFKAFVEGVYLSSATWKRKAPSTRMNDEGRIRTFLLPALGDKKLLDITLADLKRLYRDLCDPTAAGALARKAGATKATKRGGEGGARRTMRLLKAILSLAVEEQELIESPAAALKIDSDGEREVAPDEDAYTRLWGSIEQLRGESYTMQRACDCIALLALTGARRAEINHLRWRHVDLEGRRLVLGKAEHKTGRKTGKARIIALPDEAVAILTSYEVGVPDGFVFAGFRPTAPVALQRPWARIAKAAGLSPALTLHSLRHGIGTHLAAAGMAAPQIAMALGHNQWRTSERYVHAVERARGELAQKAADLVRPRKLRAVAGR
jgi:integrase